MTHIPHQHAGQFELCYDKLCARVHTSQESADALGVLAVGLIAVAIFAALSG
ncbi:MAG TPA: hypothetical protein VM681_11235 [Candidatus Thermoplasmatota archaeon]|nr:hypothetical protein [Candidatus Thermoplasmatota archaeon]